MEKKTKNKQTKTRREDVSPKDALVILPLDQTFILNKFSLPRLPTSTWLALRTVKFEEYADVKRYQQPLQACFSYLFSISRFTYPMPAFRSSLILLNNFFVPTEQLKGGKLTQREKKEKELRASLN